MTALNLRPAPAPKRDEENLLARLHTLPLAGKLIDGRDIEPRALTDFIGGEIGSALALIQVKNAQDVQRAVLFARAHQLPVTVRGAGTNLSGSTIAPGGLVLDLTLMNRILKFDPDNLQVTVEPGVKLANLQAYVEERGLFYPPDPAAKDASIGGNIATNAGGMRAVKYGVTRNFVLELEVVDGRGEILHLGAETLKNASGLDLKQLIIGAEGTLGVITQAVLRLVPKPERTCHLLCGFKDLSSGLKAVNTLLSSGITPAAAEFVERRVIAIGEAFAGMSFPLPEAAAYLIISTDGSAAQAEEDLKRCTKLMAQAGALACLPLAGAQADTVWTVRAAIARAVQATGTWEPVDAVVPLSEIAPFIAYLEELSASSGLRILPFGHAADGNVHLCILKDKTPDDIWPELIFKTLGAIYAKAQDLGGLISAEHGIGRRKRPFYLAKLPPSELYLMRAVKDAFDPDHLFNPGCSFAA